MRLVRFIVLLLIVIGAINWGLWGAFQYDIIRDIFGSDVAAMPRFFYILIGLCGIYAVSFFFSKGTCGIGCSHSSESKKED